MVCVCVYLVSLCDAGSHLSDVTSTMAGFCVSLHEGEEDEVTREEGEERGRGRRRRHEVYRREEGGREGGGTKEERGVREGGR